MTQLASAHTGHVHPNLHEKERMIDPDCSEPYDRNRIRIVNVNAHFILREYPSIPGNFAENDDGDGNVEKVELNGYDFARRVIENANDNWSKNYPMTLYQGPDRPEVKPKGVYLQLNGVYFHRDDAAYNGYKHPAGPSNLREKFGEKTGSEINIFFVEDTHKPGFLRGVGPRGAITVENTWSDYQNPNTTNTLFTYALLVNHELAHGFGLDHTFTCGESQCTHEIDEASECNPHLYDYVNDEWIRDPVTNELIPANCGEESIQCYTWTSGSNNLMNYVAVSNSLSPCQIDIIHGTLVDPNDNLPFVEDCAFTCQTTDCCVEDIPNYNSNDPVPGVKTCLPPCLPAKAFLAPFPAQLELCRTDDPIDLWIDARGSWNVHQFTIKVAEFDPDGLFLGNETFGPFDGPGKYINARTDLGVDLKFGYTYKVTLKVQNECGVEDQTKESTTIRLVPINCPGAPCVSCVPPILSTFSVLENDNLRVAFQSNEPVPSATIIKYRWNFGDGNISDEASPIHQYTAPGSYVVCQSVTDISGCCTTVCDFISVQTCMAINAGYSAQINACGVTFTDQSNGSLGNDITSWTLRPGDGNVFTGSGVFTSLIHNYAVDGIYNACLTVKDEDFCEDTFCSPIQIDNCLAANCESTSPNASFQPQSTTTLEERFTNTSWTHGGCEIVRNTWYFGDGTSCEEGDCPRSGFSNDLISHVYEAPGTYEVCLLVENDCGCTDMRCRTVVIEPAPDPVDCQLEISRLFSGSQENCTCSGIFTLDVQYTANPDATPEFIEWRVVKPDGTFEILTNQNTLTACGDAINREVSICLFVLFDDGCTASSCKDFDLCTWASRTAPPTQSLFSLSDRIQVYPNPTNRQLLVDGRRHPQRLIQIDLFDLKGQKLRSIRQIENDQALISKEALAAGTYFLKIQLQNGESQTRKIVFTD
ncbi:MAG: PKD domain-containing protein [Bacteroidota bacterium]